MNAQSLLLELHNTAHRHADPSVYAEVAEVLRLATLHIIHPRVDDPSSWQGTACVKKVGTYRYQIIFWSSFLDRFTPTTEDRLFLLLHELGHRRRGDLQRNRINSTMSRELAHHIMNMVADMLIEAELCARWFPHGVKMHQLLAEDHPTLRAFEHLLFPPMALARVYRHQLPATCADAWFASDDGPSYTQIMNYGAERFGTLLLAWLIPGRVCAQAPHCLAQIVQIYLHGWFMQAPMHNLSFWLMRVTEHCPNLQIKNN